MFRTLSPVLAGRVRPFEDVGSVGLPLNFVDWVALEAAAGFNLRDPTAPCEGGALAIGFRALVAEVVLAVAFTVVDAVMTLAEWAVVAVLEVVVGEFLAEAGRVLP